MRLTTAGRSLPLGTALGLGYAALVVANGIAPAQASTTGTVEHWGTFAGGSSSDSGDMSLSPVAITLPGTVVQVATSNSTQYALLSDGQVYAWGQDEYGQLGDGGDEDSFTVPVRVDFPAGVKIASLAADTMPLDTALAVDTNGHAWGWGVQRGRRALPGQRQVVRDPGRAAAVGRDGAGRRGRPRHLRRRRHLDRETALRLAAEYGGRPGDAAKDDPLDVAVWQAAEPDHPAWDSPWGAGRPGWHAECAAMALSVFGSSVDVHAGGADLRFPHHADHAAMAEAFTHARPCARAWLHAGTVRVDGAKMAKSTGNLVLVRDLIADYPAAAVRLMILDRPWSEDWDYAPALLGHAGQRLEELYRAASRSRSVPAAAPEIHRLLASDLNAAAAMDVGIEAGGAAARTVTATLGLS